MYLSRPTECISHHLTLIFLLLSPVNHINASPGNSHFHLRSFKLLVDRNQENFVQIGGTSSSSFLHPLSPPTGCLVIPTHWWPFEIIGFFCQKSKLSPIPLFLVGWLVPLLSVIGSAAQKNGPTNWSTGILKCAFKGNNLIPSSSRCCLHIPSEQRGLRDVPKSSNVQVADFWKK